MLSITIYCDYARSKDFNNYRNLISINEAIK